MHNADTETDDVLTDRFVVTRTLGNVLGECVSLMFW